MRSAFHGVLSLLLVAGALLPHSLAVELLGPSGVSLPVGRSPDDVAIVDLDGDGTLDLAVTNRPGGSQVGSVTILRGDGRGGFARMFVDDIPVGKTPAAIAAGDFDGDGVQDLAVANKDDPSLSILLAGTLDSPLTIPDVGRSPESIVVADFNDDGELDLAVVNAVVQVDGSDVSILLGDGHGGFDVLPSAPRVGSLPFDAAAADFDVDGNMDLAVVNFVDGTVSILKGDGRGGFVPFSDPVKVGAGPLAVATGDFDGDERVDVAVACRGDNSLSLLLGDGNGGFPESEIVRIDVAPGPGSVAAGDLDGRGAVDLVVGHEEDRSVSVLLGGVGGSLRQIVASSPRSVALSDFDADGSTDLVAVGVESDAVSVLLGDGLGGLGGIREVAVGEAPQAIAAADFNGDGATDVAVANTKAGSVSILISDSRGSFVPPPSGIDEMFEGPVSVAVDDFDGDGDADLAVANLDSAERELSILLGGGDGSFARSHDIDLTERPVSVAVGDFNADDDPDLVVVHGRNTLDNTISVLLGSDRGSFLLHPEALRLNPGSGRTVVGDLDGDGHLDLAVTNQNGERVRIFLGRGDGSFEERSPDTPLGDRPSSIAVGDINGDEHLDLVVGLLTDSGSLGILLGQGDGSFERQPPDITLGGTPEAVTVVDFNADGAADLAVANSFSNSTNILLGREDGSFLRIPDLVVGSAPMAMAPGDFDPANSCDSEAMALGDCEGIMPTDLAVVNRFDNSISVLLNQLANRADINGSNRIDGFDVAEIGRRSGRTSGDAAYRRVVDADLNGEIDGIDLALISSRFGTLRRQASPLRASLENPLPSIPGTVTLQPGPSEGDLLTVHVLVNDQEHPATAAEFAVTWDPIEVLEVVGYERGTYLSGFAQPLSVDKTTPGEVSVRTARFPIEDRPGTGQQPLISLFLRAREIGNAVLEFDESSSLLFDKDCPDERGCAVPEVTFNGGVDVTVLDTGGGDPGQRIGFVPEHLDFGQVPPGDTSHKRLRISNFGFSELGLLDVTSSLPEFTTFFGTGCSGTGPDDACFNVPPFGFVEVTVGFSPVSEGSFFGELIVRSTDRREPEARVPVSGRSSLATRSQGSILGPQSDGVQ